MKPRNKFEKAVLAQSAKLPTISKAQKQWAFRECIKHYAYRQPNAKCTTCMDCGHAWRTDDTAAECICPHCGAKLQVEITYNRKLEQRRYFNILTTCGDYQVLRMFLLHCSMTKGCPANIYTFEIGAYFWDKKGKKCIVGIKRVMGRYIDTFAYWSPFEVRTDNEAYLYVADSYLYPRYKVKDYLKRNGFKGNFYDIHSARFITAVLSNPRAETLLKAGQHGLLKLYIGRSFDLEKYWSTIKICIRHGYNIPDGSLWKDYVEILRTLGKDINNPHYVCPECLEIAHDKVLKQYNKVLAKQRQQEEREKAIQSEAKYKEDKGRFFGIVFSDNLIQVRVLESVQDIMEEGMAMHHCVYSASYYDRADSLILSATIQGKRIETIEVSLSTLEVVQSRGVCNKNTEYHDQIVELVRNNIHQIKDRLSA